MENKFELDKIAKLQKIGINRASFNNIPENPGVYFFFSSGEIVYIGKSINLKARLSSYLSTRLESKTRTMVSKAEHVSYIKVTSELESLLLEARLINKYKPKYNIIAKDDKHPLYIVITDEKFPRILSSRIKPKQKFKAMYGPFPSSYNVKKILKIIRKVIPYSEHKLGKKSCIYSQINLCNPCPNTVANTKDLKVKKILTRRYKKNIRSIKKLLDGNFSLVEKDLVREMTTYAEDKKYEEAARVRDRINILKYITQPNIPTGRFLENPNLTQDLKNKELKSLNNLLKENEINVFKLERIECFDIAHISGAFPTASMVVFIAGEPEKSMYRHFAIRQRKSRSDYDSMKEVAERRKKHLKDWGRPNLIVVDGGLGQVKKFTQFFDSLNIRVVGIAKNPDRIIFDSGKKVRLSGDSLKILQKLRDEAHRFARRYHHNLLRKNLLT